METQTQDITIDYDYAKSVRDAINSHMAWDKENQVYTNPNPLTISTHPQSASLVKDGAVGVAITITLADKIIGHVELSNEQALLLATNITNTVRNQI